MYNPVVFVKLNGDAVMPKQLHSTDAGYDLYSIVTTTIPAKETTIISTGISIELPAGMEAQVRGRSGLAFKHGILAHIGTIDPEYRGEIKVLLFNTTDKPFVINKGDRIAQLVFNEIAYAKLIEVSKLTESTRSEDGFGSTGK